MQNYWHEHKHFLKGFAVTVIITLVVGVFGSSTNEFMASVLDLAQPAPFDGTSLPITSVPDWTDIGGRSTLLSAQIPLEKMLPLPNYDPAAFGVMVADLNWKADKNLANQLVTYPVPYMGSYQSGSKEYQGSHPAIDIRAPTGTPVHAIANGKVVKVVAASSGFGMHIVIKHFNVPSPDSNETINLYSAYAHLSATNVNVGDIVTRGQIIGQSGSSGTSTTPHLHFQIDKESAPWHPWWPFTSADCAAAGVSFFDGVSAGIGQAGAIANTINPMLWVQRYLATDTTTSSDLHAADTTTTTPTNEAATTTTETTAEVTSTETVADTSTPVETPTDSTAVDTTVVAETPTTTDETVTETPEVVTETPEVVAPTSVEKIFTDVDSTHENAKAIKYLKDSGIVGGYDDGSFKPDKTVNRVEALKMLILGFGVVIDPKSELGFKDTGDQQWYADYVGTAMNRGIASGYPDNTFRPANTINRAEYLKILLFSAKISPDSVSENPYPDVPADAWYSAFANYSKLKNIFPLTSNLFEGTKGVTRAQVAETIYRIIMLRASNASAYSDSL